MAYRSDYEMPGLTSPPEWRLLALISILGTPETEAGSETRTKVECA